MCLLRYIVFHLLIPRIVLQSAAMGIAIAIALDSVVVGCCAKGKALGNALGGTKPNSQQAVQRAAHMAHH